MECVAICPSEGALFIGPSKKRAIGPQVVAAGIVLIFIVSVGLAKWSGHWQSPIPDAVYQQLIPQVRELGHP